MPRVDVMYDPWLTSEKRWIPQGFYRQLASAVASALECEADQVRVYTQEVKEPNLARRPISIDITASDRRYRELPDPRTVIQRKADEIRDAVYDMLPPEIRGHNQVSVWLTLVTGAFSST